MTSRERAVTPSAWVDHSGAKSGLSLIGDFVDKTVAVTVTELRKMRHDVAALFMRMLQPVLWLAIYGEVMSRTRAITTGDIPFIDFITPGIMAQSALFIAIFSGMSVIWERDLGIAHKFVASPAPRDALALGKALSGGVRALTGAAVVYVLGLALGVKMNLSPLAVLAVLAMVVLAATTFSAFSLVIAFIVRTKERMMGIGQVLTMPFFFASNAIYPTSVMPGWLKALAEVNPLSYEVDAIRAMMLANGTSTYGLAKDFAVLVVVAAVLIVVAGRLYPRAAT